MNAYLEVCLNPNSFKGPAKFDCRISLDQAGPELRPGMSSNLVITAETVDNALWVPSQALFERDGRSFVIVRGQAKEYGTANRLEGVFERLFDAVEEHAGALAFFGSQFAHVLAGQGESAFAAEGLDADGLQFLGAPGGGDAGQGTGFQFL